MNATTAALVWCAIQVTVLTGGVAVVYLAARRVHPRAGAAAAGGGLVMVVALTMLAASPWPRWNLSTGSNRGKAASAAAATASSTAVVAPEAVLPGQSSDRRELAVAQQVGERPSYWRLLVDAMNRPRGSAEEAGVSTAKPQAARMFVWLFFAGAMVAAGRLFWSIVHVRRLARSGFEIDDARIGAVVHEFLERLTLPGPVAVRESAELTTPATVGWRRPVVLLPEAWRAWSDAELRAVVAHELAHIAGRDYAAWFVARLAVVAHFYHPLVRWLASRLQLEQELAADMAAARVVGDSKQYLHSLAALALSMPANRMAGPARTLFPSRSLLVRRVEMLRANGVMRPRRGGVRYATFAVVALVGLAAAGLRGPGVALTASALAEETATAPATAATADGDGGPKDAVADEYLAAELVPETAAYVVYAPVARLVDDKRLATLMNRIRGFMKSGSDVDAGDAILEVIDEAMMAGPQNFTESGPYRWVGRTRTAEQLVQLLAMWRKDANSMHALMDGQEVEFSLDGEIAIRQADARTLVFDYVPDAIVDGEWKGALPPLKNPMPPWHEKWRAAQRDGIVLTVVDFANAFPNGIPLPPNEVIQNSLSALFMQMASPLATNAKWAVLDVEMNDRLRIAGTFQCASEESAAKVRDTLQAITTFTRNFHDQYAAAMFNAERPNDEPAKKLLEVFRKLSDEARHLLTNAEFKVTGAEVNAVLESKSSADNIAKLAAGLSTAIEEAQPGAQQAMGIGRRGSESGIPLDFGEPTE